MDEGPTAHWVNLIFEAESDESDEGPNAHLVNLIYQAESGMRGSLHN